VACFSRLYALKLLRRPPRGETQAAGVLQGAD
jgi:hypothetical protein